MPRTTHTLGRSATASSIIFSASEKGPQGRIFPQSARARNAMALEFDALPFLYPHKGKNAEGAETVAREESEHKVSALVNDNMEDKLIQKKIILYSILLLHIVKLHNHFLIF